MDDLLSLLTRRLFSPGDPEAQGAAAASSAMEPAVTDHFRGVATGLLDWSRQQQALQERLRGLPLAQQLSDPEYRESAMNAALAFAPGAGLAMRGARAAETAALPALTSEQVASRLGNSTQQNFRPVEYGPPATPSTPTYQQIQTTRYGSGNSGSWIGRTSRFGDEDLAVQGYNPRYDQSIYPGGQVKPPPPAPENPLLRENFEQMPVTYPFPYGPNTFPPRMNNPMPNPRYNAYKNPLPYDAPPSGMTLPPQPPPSPQEMNSYLQQYMKQRLDSDYITTNQAGANGNNYTNLSDALRNILLSQKLWGSY